MSKTRIIRIASAVIAAYVVNAILVVVTNQLLSSMAADAKRHSQFLVIDLLSQCLYTIVAGYLCAAIAGPLRHGAITSLIGLGLTVGTFSLVTSWNREPHWYSISLLLVYAPCVWVGYLATHPRQCRKLESVPVPFKRLEIGVANSIRRNPT